MVPLCHLEFKTTALVDFTSAVVYFFEEVSRGQWARVPLLGIFSINCNLDHQHDTDEPQDFYWVNR